MEKRRIRHATLSDVPALAAIEAACFPAAEAATEQSFYERVRAYPEGFWLLFENGELLSFADGMATDIADLTDEMYETAGMHNPDGKWQMIFGLCTRPDRQKQGLATELMNAVRDSAKTSGRAGLVLTCKKEKIPFYEHLGYACEGLSESVHGNTAWYQMRLSF